MNRNRFSIILIAILAALSVGMSAYAYNVTKKAAVSNDTAATLNSENAQLKDQLQAALITVSQPSSSNTKEDSAPTSSQPKQASSAASHPPASSAAPAATAGASAEQALKTVVEQYYPVPENSTETQRYDAIKGSLTANAQKRYAPNSPSSGLVDGAHEAPASASSNPASAPTASQTYTSTCKVAKSYTHTVDSTHQTVMAVCTLEISVNNQAATTNVMLISGRAVLTNGKWLIDDMSVANPQGVTVDQFQ